MSTPGTGVGGQPTAPGSIPPGASATPAEPLSAGSSAVGTLPASPHIGVAVVPPADLRPPAAGLLPPDHVDLTGGAASLAGRNADVREPAWDFPEMAEICSVAFPFAVPLNRRFRGVEHREGLLLLGPSGWAEWAPFPEYDDWEAARWLRAAIEAGWGRWPQPQRTSVPVNVIVPALPPAEVSSYVSDAAARTGATTYKVKVGGEGSALADDLARVATVRATLSEAGISDPKLRLDANGSWTVQQARRAAGMFSAEFGDVLDYLEQPCTTTTELAELRYRLGDDDVSMRIAVDEGLRRARDLFSDDLACSLRSAGDVLIVKVAPVGGVWRALRLVEAIGLPTVVSGEMNTSVGLSAGLALAAALPELAGACGLGTGLLLADDVCARSLIPQTATLPVVRMLPDEKALARGAELLGQERAIWWRERLARCARLLAVI
ncbi:MAG: o-succinylbenzoate synthase [Candidatus Nanopelagicales bacterium]